MKNARQAIFDRLKTRLNQTSHFDKRMAAARSHIKTHPSGVIPKRAKITGEAALSLFCKMARQASATVVIIKNYAQLNDIIAKYLQQHHLPEIIRMGDDKRLKTLAKDCKFSYVSKDRRFGDDRVGVSHATGAAAETGTLVLESGPSNPTSLNFLPEHHIVVLHSDDIRGSYEEIWEGFRRTKGKGNGPRTINMITGPSRSADIEQTLVLGAHGPLALHIVIVHNGDCQESAHE